VTFPCSATLTPLALEAPINRLPDPTGVAVSSDRLGDKCPAPRFRTPLVIRHRTELPKGVRRYRMTAIATQKLLRHPGRLAAAVHRRTQSVLWFFARAGISPL